MARPEHLLRESTGFFEFRALTRWMLTFGPQFRGKRILVEGDNASVAYGVESAYSDKAGSMEEIICFRKLCLRFNLIVRVRHIVGDVYNAVADALSHNRVSLARQLALDDFGCPLTQLATSRLS